MNTKHCRRCKEVKDVLEFGPAKQSRDGLSCWCRECHRQYLSDWYKDRPDRKERRAEAIRRAQKKYFKTRYKAAALARAKKLRKRPDVRMVNNVRSQMSKYLLGSSSADGCFRFLDYTIDELRSHLESMFKPGMTWDNYGRTADSWQIDHILPVSKFPASSPEHPNFKKVWALSNLQPLWRHENLKKSAKLL